MQGTEYRLTHVYPYSLDRPALPTLHVKKLRMCFFKLNEKAWPGFMNHTRIHECIQEFIFIRVYTYSTYLHMFMWIYTYNMCTVVGKLLLKSNDVTLLLLLFKETSYFQFVTHFPFQQFRYSY